MRAESNGEEIQVEKEAESKTRTGNGTGREANGAARWATRYDSQNEGRGSKDTEYDCARWLWMPGWKQADAEKQDGSELVAGAEEKPS